MLNKNQVLRSIKNPETFNEKAINYAHHISNITIEEKQEILDILLRIPYYMRLNQNLQSSRNYKSQLKWLIDDLRKSPPINKDILKDHNLEKISSNELIDHLEDILKSEINLSEATKELSDYQKFLYNSLNSADRTSLVYFRNYFSNSYILKQYYKEYKIDSNNKYHILLSLYSISFLRYHFQHFTRLDLIAASFEYFYDLKVRFTSLDELVLKKILKVVNDFADHFNLEHVDEWDVEQVKFNAVYNYAMVHSSEQQLFLEGNLFSISEN